MGLEPVQVMGQQCSDEGVTATHEPGVTATQVATQSYDWYNALLTGFLVATILALVVIVGALWKYVRKLKKDVYFMEHQLCDHYDMDAELDTRLKSVEMQTASLDGRCDNIEGSADVIDDVTDGLRYGLMQIGGFMQTRRLTPEQRSYMMTQERSNCALWNMRQRQPDNTDAEGSGEEEENDQDEALNDEAEVGQLNGDQMLETLCNRLRDHLNEMLAQENYRDADQIQTAIMCILNAIGGPTREGFTDRVITEVRNIFQRLFRRARNEGRLNHAEVYRGYVDEMFHRMTE